MLDDFFERVLYGPFLEWGTCWRCGLEVQVDFPWASHMQRTAYGWCCDHCLVEMPRAEWNALLTMNELASDLVGSRD